MRISLFAMLLLGVACWVGCGSEKLPDGMPELFDYTVIITQDGKPLEGATVVMDNPASTTPYGVAGETDSAGKAKLLTGTFEGAPAGEYKVIVTKDVATPSQYGNMEPGTDDAKAEWRANRAKEYRPTHRLVDSKYSSKKTSDLSVSISGAGETTLDVGAAVDEIIIPEGSAPEPTK